MNPLNYEQHDVREMYEHLLDLLDESFKKFLSNDLLNVRSCNKCGNLTYTNSQTSCIIVHSYNIEFELNSMLSFSEIYDDYTCDCGLCDSYKELIIIKKVPFCITVSIQCEDFTLLNPMDLSKSVFISSNMCTYNLASIIFYCAEHRHYTCIFLSDKAIYADDSTISEVNYLEKIMELHSAKAHPYLVFYTLDESCHNKLNCAKHAGDIDKLAGLEFEASSFNMKGLSFSI
jgi:hypothetical protein